MKESWIVEVLADLRQFTRRNGYRRLADEIARTEALARDEFAGHGGAPGEAPPRHPPPGE